MLTYTSLDLQGSPPHRDLDIKARFGSLPVPTAVGTFGGGTVQAGPGISF
jgi:hypothetical protein